METLRPTNLLYYVKAAVVKGFQTKTAREENIWGFLHCPEMNKQQ